MAKILRRSMGFTTLKAGKRLNNRKLDFKEIGDRPEVCLSSVKSPKDVFMVAANC
jgi:uncharacterized protein (UPF0212 family)